MMKRRGDTLLTDTMCEPSGADLAFGNADSTGTGTGAGAGTLGLGSAVAVGEVAVGEVAGAAEAPDAHTAVAVSDVITAAVAIATVPMRRTCMRLLLIIDLPPKAIYPQSHSAVASCTRVRMGSHGALEVARPPDRSPMRHCSR